MKHHQGLEYEVLKRTFIPENELVQGYNEVCIVNYITSYNFNNYNRMTNMNVTCLCISIVVYTNR